jgi:hypothetical protein
MNGVDRGRYNVVHTNKVAIVFQNIDGEPPLHRDLLIYAKMENSTKKLNILHSSCDPMIYTLMFPYGDVGHLLTKMFTLSHYYSFRLAIRRNRINHLYKFGKLTQQFIIDAYIKIESNNLNYIKLNQNKLRTEKYSGLMDYINENIKNGRIGRSVIVPSTFKGGPRAMVQNYQDAMAIV